MSTATSTILKDADCILIAPIGSTVMIDGQPFIVEAAGDIFTKGDQQGRVYLTLATSPGFTDESMEDDSRESYLAKWVHVRQGRTGDLGQAIHSRADLAAIIESGDYKFL